MNSTLAILAILDGISYAALVFLVSVGLSLIFGVLRVVNVAHGSLYAFGAYLAATFSLVIAQVSPWLTYPALLVASIVIGVVCGGFIERFLLRPLYGRDDVLQLLITFAAFMIMDNLQRLIWGVQPIFAAEPLKLLPNISVFGVNYTSYRSSCFRAWQSRRYSDCVTSCGKPLREPLFWRSPRIGRRQPPSASTPNASTLLRSSSGRAWRRSAARLLRRPHRWCPAWAPT